MVACTLWYLQEFWRSGFKSGWQKLFDGSGIIVKMGYNRKIYVIYNCTDQLTCLLQCPLNRTG